MVGERFMSIWIAYLWPRIVCLIMEAVISVCCRKLLGVPPPRYTTDVLTERAIVWAVSTRSWMTSNWNGFLRSIREVAIPTPIDESGILGQKIGTLAL